MNRQQRRNHLKSLGILNKAKPFLLFKSIGEFIKEFNLRDENGTASIVDMTNQVGECLHKGIINANQYRILLLNLNDLKERVERIKDDKSS